MHGLPMCPDEFRFFVAVMWARSTWLDDSNQPPYLPALSWDQNSDLAIAKGRELLGEPD